MRAATAYFAGVGTVAVAIAGGLGGGLLLGDIMSPQQPKYPSSEVTRLERKSTPPITAANTTTQPVPYMAAPQVASAVAEQPAQEAQRAPSQQQAQPEAPLQQASTQPAEPPKQPEPSTKPQPVAAVQAAPPEESIAKARDADVRREARRAEDRRKAERRQQWADKRKWRQHQDDDLRDVEAAVRADTEQRPSGRSEPRTLFNREPSFGSGRMTLFDD